MKHLAWPLALAAVSAYAQINPGGGGGGGAVNSVNGKTGTVVLAPGDVGAQTAPQHIAGATAVYTLLPPTISGTTIQDQSGNGNNATANAQVTSGPYGVSLSNTGAINLPAALNSTRTFVYTLTVPGVYNSVANSLPTLVGGSNGVNGLLIIAQQDFQGSAYYGAPWSISIYAAGAARTAIRTPLASGPHTLTVALGAGSGDLDQIYIDGKEYTTYTMQGASAGLQTAGNLIIGASVNNFVIPHTIYQLRMYSTKLTAAQVLQETYATAGDMTGRGLPWQPLTWNMTQNNAVWMGNSITDCVGASSDNTCWNKVITFASTTPAFTRIKNSTTAVAGIPTQSMLLGTPAVLDQYCTANTGQTIVNLWELTNSFNLSKGETAAQIVAELWKAAALVKQRGCIPFVSTMISRAGNDVNGTPYDTDKNAVDALVRQQAKANGVMLTDVAAEPLVGADGAANNTTNFPDGTHPADPMQPLIAAAVARAIDFTFGYNDSNPHIYTATAAMGANDGTIFTDCTAACTLTLPSIIGQTGAVYKIVNRQSAQTVTLKTFSAAQTINGIDYSTTGLTVPANTTLTYAVTVPNGATGGAVWIGK